MSTQKRTKPIPQEAVAFARAMEAADLTDAAIARHVGLGPPQVRQWRVGARPVPASRAVALAKLLGCDPGDISRGYAEVRANERGGAAAALNLPVVGNREAAQSMRQVESDIEAIQLGIAAMISAMVVHQPAESADVAAAIRRSVPAQHRNSGFLSELLVTLDKASRA